MLTGFYAQYALTYALMAVI